MWPSSWATILAQVAEVTRHPVMWIKRNMPCAQVYQYQQIFFAQNRHWAVRPDRNIEIDSYGKGAIIGRND